MSIGRPSRSPCSSIRPSGQRRGGSGAQARCARRRRKYAQLRADHLCAWRPRDSVTSSMLATRSAPSPHGTVARASSARPKRRLRQDREQYLSPAVYIEEDERETATSSRSRMHPNVGEETLHPLRTAVYTENEPRWDSSQNGAERSSRVKKTERSFRMDSYVFTSIAELLRVINYGGICLDPSFY